MVALGGLVVVVVCGYSPRAWVFTWLLVVLVGLV